MEIQHSVSWESRLSANEASTYYNFRLYHHLWIYLYTIISISYHFKKRRLFFCEESSYFIVGSTNRFWPQPSVQRFKLPGLVSEHISSVYLDAVHVRLEIGRVRVALLALALPTPSPCHSSSFIFES
jgi:hypothetical protein